ncbi:MAG: outer membrane beta-barrel protein, partial [Flavobacteriales bacterium]
YIEVPVLLNYETSLLNIEGGAYFGVLTSSKLVSNNLNFDITQPEPEKTDIGFMLGISYDITEKISASFRYSQSLVPVRDYEDVGINPLFDGGMYHSVLHLTMRYKF